MTEFPLLGEGDPPPFVVRNPESDARVLFVCDHSGRAIPRRLHGLGVADWVLERHVAWDIGAGDVAERLAQHFDAPLVCAQYSRLVIDTNRPPHDPTLCTPLSEGIAIPGNIDLTEADLTARRAGIFDPYHAAIEAQLGRMGERGVPALIAIHSCTPVFDRVVRPWHVGVLWDKDPRIPVALLERLAAEPEICVGDNEPYSGRDPHDFTIDHHGEAAGIPHVSLELRQDLIDTPEGASQWSGILARALEPILGDEALYAYLS